jgi:release factor glutamine methyltransferase
VTLHTGPSAAVSVGEARQRGIAFLADSSESARADVLLLLAHVLERTREWIVAHDDEMLSDERLARFCDSCERRSKGAPVAYLLGAAGFYGREFFVNESVLVPRPETEHLIDEVLRFIRGRSGAALRVLDVGTGCGAIACTIAAQTQAIVDGTDVSAAAVAIANENARHLDVAERCRFYHGDLAVPVAHKRYDVVVANLPYVPTSDLPTLPNPAAYEPRAALDGGPDGLTLYRRLLAHIPLLLKPDAMLLCEAAPATIEGLTSMVQTTLPRFAITVGHDYAGLTRFLRASS